MFGKRGKGQEGQKKQEGKEAQEKSSIRKAAIKQRKTNQSQWQVGQILSLNKHLISTIEGAKKNHPPQSPFELGFFVPTKGEPPIQPTINHFFNKYGSICLPKAYPNGGMLFYKIEKTQSQPAKKNQGNQESQGNSGIKGESHKGKTGLSGQIAEQLIASRIFKGILEPNATQTLASPSPPILGTKGQKRAAQVPQWPSVIIVPALAFGTNGHRIGYGKGYYDKFFHSLQLAQASCLQNTGALKIGICHQSEVIEGIPAESWDVPVDLIVTNKGVIKVIDRKV